MRAILVDFDADFEAGSLDEAYLDVTDYCQQHGLTGNLSSLVPHYWRPKILIWKWLPGRQTLEP